MTPANHNHGPTDAGVTVPGCPRCAELMPRDTEGFPLFNGARWSGRKGMPVPSIGADVHVTMNGLGPATVIAHEPIEGYLGLRVRLHNPPEWFRKQNGSTRSALVFGAEVEPPHRAE